MIANFEWTLWYFPSHKILFLFLSAVFQFSLCIIIQFLGFPHYPSACSIHFHLETSTLIFQTLSCMVWWLQERNQLSITLTNLQVDFDNLNARLEEEAETAASLRAQLQRSQADYAQLKSRYDKDITARVEEFEETRFVLPVLSKNTSYRNFGNIIFLHRFPFCFSRHYVRSTDLHQI